MTKEKIVTANSKTQKAGIPENASKKQDPRLSKGSAAEKAVQPDDAGPLPDADNCTEFALESWKKFKAKYAGRTVFLEECCQ